jgi:benzoate 4-monooxygenase
MSSGKWCLNRDCWKYANQRNSPERWEKVTERQKSAFIPFSYGPRACVGRNVVSSEISCRRLGVRY